VLTTGLEQSLTLPSPLEEPPSVVGAFSSWRQVESELWVAGPGLEGGQLAVLRFTRRLQYHATIAAYSCVREMYVLQSTKSEGFAQMKFTGTAHLPYRPGPEGLP
jgi:hypothetical protein